MKKYFVILSITLLFFASCGGNDKETTVNEFADTAIAYVNQVNKYQDSAKILLEYADTTNYYLNKVNSIEANLDMENIELFFQMQDSLEHHKQELVRILNEVFAQNKDTLYLPFEQQKNLEKVKILNVWVTGFEYDKILIAASVEAIDNSSFEGPHLGLVILNKNKKKQNVGGGIQGPNNQKLKVGETYIFSGVIDNLHSLSDFKSLVFDEEIKKW